VASPPSAWSLRKGVNKRRREVTGRNEKGDSYDYIMYLGKGEREKNEPAFKPSQKRLLANGKKKRPTSSCKKERLAEFLGRD